MKYAYRIKLADTDAAGRIYFASACRIAHEAFEHYLDVIGFGVETILASHPFVLPVVRAEADFNIPLGLGETISVDTTVQSVGDKSATFRHVLYDGRNRPAVEVTITHAAVSKKTGKATSLPTALRQALTRN